MPYKEYFLVKDVFNEHALVACSPLLHRNNIVIWALQLHTCISNESLQIFCFKLFLRVAIKLTMKLRISDLHVAEEEDNWISLLQKGGRKN